MRNERVRDTRAETHVALGIATTGRRAILRAVLPHLVEQSRLPDEIVICAADASDVDRAALGPLAGRTRVVIAEKGLCRQRNRILDCTVEADLLLFLDDDFLAAPAYLEEMVRIFQRHPEVVMTTGTVDADGILGPGIPLDEGLRYIHRPILVEASGEAEQECTIYNGYGCNMAVRMSTVRGYGLRFDENLPLYGWLEDVDFSRQLARHGRVVRSLRLRGVHLGTKSGRTSGLKLGYSQIANPVYLMRKKTMSPGQAAPQIARNLAANAIRSFHPEPWVDRKGRLWGNMRAVGDLLRGRLAPQNVNVLE